MKRKNFNHTLKQFTEREQQTLKKDKRFEEQQVQEQDVEDDKKATDRSLEDVNEELRQEVVEL